MACPITTYHPNLSMALPNLNFIHHTIHLRALRLALLAPNSPPLLSSCCVVSVSSRRPPHRCVVRPRRWALCRSGTPHGPPWHHSSPRTTYVRQHTLGGEGGGLGADVCVFSSCGVQGWRSSRPSRRARYPTPTHTKHTNTSSHAKPTHIYVSVPIPLLHHDHCTNSPPPSRSVVL